MEPETLDNIKEYKFFEVFKLRPDGNFEPRRAIDLRGLIIHPGTPFKSIAGVDFYEYTDYGLGVIKKDDGVLKIKEFYPPNQ